MPDNNINVELNNLEIATQIVLNNQEEVLDTIEDGDQIEILRTTENYLSSLQPLASASHRLVEEIDEDAADRHRQQLVDHLESERNPDSDGL